MSHSTKIGPYTFIHDGGDAFGNVVTIVNTSGTRFQIAGRFLRDFVAEQVRNEKIAQLEQASHAELLGLK